MMRIQAYQKPASERNIGPEVRLSGYVFTASPVIVEAGKIVQCFSDSVKELFLTRYGEARDAQYQAFTGDDAQRVFDALCRNKCKGAGVKLLGA